MLARRILGVLRQYPNPNVAYLTLRIAEMMSYSAIYSAAEYVRFPALEPPKFNVNTDEEIENPAQVKRKKAIKDLTYKYFAPAGFFEQLEEYRFLRRNYDGKNRRLPQRLREKYNKVRKLNARYGPFLTTTLSEAYAKLRLAYPGKGDHDAMREYLQYICGPEGQDFQDNFYKTGRLSDEEDAEFERRLVAAGTQRARVAEINAQIDAANEKLEKARWVIRFKVAKYKGKAVPVLIDFDDSAITIHEAGRTDVIVPWLAKIVNAWLKAHKDTLNYLFDFGWGDDGIEHLSIDEQKKARDLIDGALKRMLTDSSYAKQLAEQSNAVHKAYDQLRFVRQNAAFIADWAIATRPDLLSLTVNQAVHRARRWHAALRRQQKIDAERELAAKPGSTVFVTGPYTFYALDTKAQLEDEGQCQGHCVGSYWKDVQEGKTTIYSVRTPEKRIATIEVVKGAERQVMGRFNKDIRNQADRKAIAEFFVYTGISSRDYAQEMKEVHATPKPPETLSGLMGVDRAFGRFGFRY